MGGVNLLLQQLLDRINPRREPVVYATLVVALGLTAYNVYVKHTPLSDLVSGDYWQGVILVAGGLVARFSVFAKGNVSVVEQGPDTAEPVGPDFGPTGPSESDEEAVLTDEHGEPDADGVYDADESPDEPEQGIA